MFRINLLVPLFHNYIHTQDSGLSGLQKVQKKTEWSQHWKSVSNKTEIRCFDHENHHHVGGEIEAGWLNMDHYAPFKNSRRDRQRQLKNSSGLLLWCRNLQHCGEGHRLVQMWTNCYQVVVPVFSASSLSSALNKQTLK